MVILGENNLPAGEEDRDGQNLQQNKVSSHMPNVGADLSVHTSGSRPTSLLACFASPHTDTHFHFLHHLQYSLS